MTLAGILGGLAQRYRAIAERGWPITTDAVALGVLNILTYLFDYRLGITGELAKWANLSVGITGVSIPALLGKSTLAGCRLVFNPCTGVISTGAMLDGGLILGASIAAIFANEFKLRYPRQPIR